jgi:hypothetical protein
MGHDGRETGGADDRQLAHFTAAPPGSAETLTGHRQKLKSGSRPTLSDFAFGNGEVAPDDRIDEGIEGPSVACGILAVQAKVCAKDDPFALFLQGKHSGRIAGLAAHPRGLFRRRFERWHVN